VPLYIFACSHLLSLHPFGLCFVLLSNLIIFSALLSFFAFLLLVYKLCPNAFAEFSSALLYCRSLQLPIIDSLHFFVNQQLPPLLVFAQFVLQVQLFVLLRHLYDEVCFLSLDVLSLGFFNHVLEFSFSIAGCLLEPVVEIVTFTLDGLLQAGPGQLLSLAHLNAPFFPRKLYFGAQMLRPLLSLLLFGLYFSW
jgi:hypothetical protein